MPTTYTERTHETRSCQPRSHGEMQNVQHAAEAMAVDGNIFYRSSRMSSISRVSRSSSRTKISKSTSIQRPGRGCTRGLSAIEAEGPPVNPPHAHALICSLLLKHSSWCSRRERYQIHVLCVRCCALFQRDAAAYIIIILYVRPHMNSSFL